MRVQGASKLFGVLSPKIRSQLEGNSGAFVTERYGVWALHAQKPINMPVGGKESLLISDAGNWWGRVADICSKADSSPPYTSME